MNLSRVEAKKFRNNRRLSSLSRHFQTGVQVCASVKCASYIHTFQSFRSRYKPGCWDGHFGYWVQNGSVENRRTGQNRALGAGAAFGVQDACVKYRLKVYIRIFFISKILALFFFLF